MYSMVKKMENINNFELDSLIGLIMEDTSREVCINKMPLLLAKNALYKRVIEQAKLLKKEIEMATKIIGQYKNDYFEIEEKEHKKTVLKVQSLDECIEKLENNKDKLSNEQQVLLNQLKDEINEDKRKATVERSKDKLKILKKINESEADNIIEIKISKELVLKETKSLLNEIEKNNIKNDSSSIC